MRQVPFWKSLFKGIAKIEIIETKTAKLQGIEPILLELLDQIIYQVRAEDDRTFEEFNYCSEQDELFDDLFM